MHLGERRHRQVGLVLQGPGERRPAKLGRIAAARAGVAHRPAELEHRLAVEVETGEATAPDQRPVRSVARHPFTDPVRRPPGRHVRGPCLHRRAGPGAGPIRDDRIAVQEEQVVDIVGTDRRQDKPRRSTGSVGASAGRLASIYSVNSVATPQRRLESRQAHVLTLVAGGSIQAVTPGPAECSNQRS